MDVQSSETDDIPNEEPHKDDELPQCKIKRNYSCNHCAYFTQNPRFHLTHLRDIHGERIVINKCNLCLYASRHYQKLVRHMRMVHGSTEGIAGHSRKRAPADDGAWQQQQKKIPIPPIVPLLLPVEPTINIANLSHDLKLSRNSLKDIAALYFAENQIEEIMSQMEEADDVQLPTPTVPIKRNTSSSSFLNKLTNSVADEGRLTCNCSYVSECLSESFIHRKTCTYLDGDKNENGVPPINLSSGSTRCKRCRVWCSSTDDLLMHQKNCSQTGCLLSEYDVQNERQKFACEDDGDLNPMENRVFVWNKVLGAHNSDFIGNEKVNYDPVKEYHGEPKDTEEATKTETTYFGLGKVAENDEATKQSSPKEEAGGSSLKKVFKCPRCSFWASTASRFHVHIVGHLNKKPFRCSLCAYCSNWRWDITKHIRLKARRNPGHENARVLVSNETGRRNYTKYNRYITLMKVTDEDGLPKPTKSGDMTPFQMASLEFLNDDNKEASELINDELLGDHPGQTDTSGAIVKTNCVKRLLNETEQKIIGGELKRNSQPPIRVSDDPNTNVKAESFSNNSFKCHRCDFRHPSREAVLKHVKIHYKDSNPNFSATLQAAVNSTNLYMNKVFAAAIGLSQKKLFQEQKTSQSDITRSGNSNALQCEGVTSSINSLSLQEPSSEKTLDDMPMEENTIEKANETSSTLAENSQTSSTFTTTATNCSTCPSSTTTLDQSSFFGGTSKSAMLLGVTTNANFATDANERREPSPFRCGHCHQVSNWKHVIQRHCRLKHSGYIRIETFDRKSDERDPIYRPIDFCSNGQSRNLLTSSDDNYILEPIKVTHQQQAPSLVINNDDLSKSKSDQDSSVSLGSSDQDLLLKRLEVAGYPAKSSVATGNQLKCPSCPYISESKTQLNFHISLHKPTQYECNRCSYVCTKQQHLSNHVKTHEPPPNTVTVDLNSKKSPKREKPPTPETIKVISYCPNCPESFVNSSGKLEEHLKAHGANLNFKCEVCNFSATQEASLLLHSFIHTNAYKEELEQIVKGSNEDSEYPAQKVQQITVPKTGAPSWIVAGSEKQISINKEPKAASVEQHTAENAIENTVLNKCSDCSSQIIPEQHLQDSKHPENHICEHCDFNANSEDALNEHRRTHLDAIDSRKSADSYDDLELIVTNNSTKDKDECNKPKTRVVNLKNDLKPERTEKIDKEIVKTLRRSRRSSTQKSEKKSSPPTPPSSHKTILVNPKTGQVIRRN